MFGPGTRLACTDELDRTVLLSRQPTPRTGDRLSRGRSPRRSPRRAPPSGWSLAASPDSYLRLAGVISLLSFAIGFSPEMFARRLNRVASALEEQSGGPSAASIIEVAALHTAGRLQFTQPLERWIRESTERGGFRVVGIDADIAVDAGLIPASALPDPFDRCLVATARAYDIPFVTRDRTLLDYATRTGLVRVVDASR